MKFVPSGVIFGDMWVIACTSCCYWFCLPIAIWSIDIIKLSFSSFCTMFQWTCFKLSEAGERSGPDFCQVQG